MAEIRNPDAAVFDARERAVLNFTTTMLTNRGAVSSDAGDQCDAAFETMREFFDEPQIVEMGLAIATLAGMNLFNNMFGIDPEDEPMVSRTGIDPPPVMAAE